MPSARRKKRSPLSAGELSRAAARAGKPPMLPPADWRAEQVPLLMREHGAFGCFFGLKRRGGRYTSEPALVVLTSRKHDPRPRSGVRRVPRRVSWKDGVRRHALATDVLEIRPEFELMAGAVFGPGDGAFAGGEFASIGAAVHSERFGRCLTTVGHLFHRAAPGAVARVESDGESVDCIAREITQITTVDYALLELPETSVADNLFRDRVRIGPVYTPILDDTGKRVFLLDRHGQATPMVCTHVRGQFTAAGGVFDEVIVTDQPSIQGQSGGALIDESWRLWGFLLGVLSSQFSIFAPARLIFDVAGVQLVNS